MVLKIICSLLYSGFIFTRITALTDPEAAEKDKVALHCVACRVRLDVSSKDIKIVSFEDIARAQDLSTQEDDTQILEKTFEKQNTTLKENIIKNRVKAMKIAEEIENEKEEAEQLKSERKTIDDSRFSGETYFKFINHINNIKNAAAEIVASKTKNTKDRKESYDGLSIEHNVLLRRANKPNENDKDRVDDEERDSDTSVEDALPNVKFEVFPDLKKKAPSRTIPDSKFITTTMRTTKYKTAIPKSMLKRKYKKYSAHDKYEKTEMIKITTFSDKKNNVNKVTKNNHSVKALPNKVVWQAVTLSNESSLET